MQDKIRKVEPVSPVTPVGQRQKKDLPKQDDFSAKLDKAIQERLKKK